MSAPLNANSVIVPPSIWTPESIQQGQEVAAAMCERFDLLNGQVEVIPLSTGLLIAQTTLEGLAAPDIVRGKAEKPTLSVGDATYSTDFMGERVYDVITEHIANKRKGVKLKDLQPHMDSEAELRGGVSGFSKPDRYPKTVTFLWANGDGSIHTAYTKMGKRYGRNVGTDDKHYDVRFRPAAFIQRKATSLLEV